MLLSTQASIQKPDYRKKVPHQKQHLMQDKKSGLSSYHARSVSYGMLERQRTCCTSEWVDTALIQEQGRQKNQLRSTFANWTTPWRTCKWGRERERERASGSSPHNAVCTLVGSGWVMSLRMAPQHMPSQHGIWHMQWTVDSSLPVLCLSDNCEHFTLSVLYRVSSTVCLKKVLRDWNIA